MTTLNKDAFLALTAAQRKKFVAEIVVDLTLDIVNNLLAAKHAINAITELAKLHDDSVVTVATLNKSLWLIDTAVFTYFSSAAKEEI